MPRARCLACLLLALWAPAVLHGWEQPFGSAQTIDAFADPEAVRLADLDGDSDLDVVAAGAGGVAWWREQGGIYLATAVSATAAVDVATADIDGDGDLDLVAASPAAGLVFFRNTAGDGSAWSSVAVQSAVAGVALALGDVDGDGRADVVAALSGTVEWWRNSAGDGSAWTRQAIATFAGASGVALGDLDRDGALDVVASADGATDAVAYFRNTSGWPRTDVATGVDGARGPRVADLDGDGYLDVVAAASTAGTLAWYRNDGTPANGFPSGVQLAVAAGVRAGEPIDLDLDGDLDLVGLGPEDASWLDIADPMAPELASYEIGAVGDLRAVAAGDLDGDGDLEVVTAGAADDELSLWPNLSQHRTSTWRPPVDLLTSFDGARGLVAGDLDGDGDLDLVATATIADQVVWLESTGSGWVQHAIETLNGAFKLALGDLDGDGDLDVLAAADAANTVAWWRNDLATGGAFARRNVDTLLLGARGVTVGDMDRDGDLDVVAGGTSDDIAVYRNDGTATTFTRQFITTTFNRVHDVQVADIDGDGDLDVVAAGHTADEMAWWENVDGAATTWSAKQTISGITLDGGFSVHAADIDGDGDLDVLSTADQSDETTFWENTSGDGSAWAEHTLPYLNQPQTAIAADLDADGDLDVVATAYKDGGKVSAVRNLDGIGHTWQRIDLTIAFDGACSVAVADFDRDGQPDIVAAAETVDKVALWSNGGGQVALASTATAASMPANAETALFKLVLTPRGLPTENAVELAAVALALEEAPGDPLDAAEAAALFQAIEIVRDNSSGGVVGSLDATDVTVGSATSFVVDATGVLVVEVQDGLPVASVAQGASGTFFVAAQTVASYAAVPLTGVRLRQLGARTRVEDRTNDVALRPEGAADPQSPAFPLNSLADLALTVDDSADPVVAGATLSYEIELVNHGPNTAFGTTLTLDLPDGATLVATDGCAEDPAGAPTCTLGTLVNGATATVTVQVAVAGSAAAPLDFAVVAASTTHDPQSGDNQASESTAVIASADLSVEILSRRDYGDGQPLEMQVVVRNLGPGPAIDATVAVDLPAALEGAIHTCTGTGGGTCGAAGSGDVADLVDLPSGAIVTYRIHGTVADGLTTTLSTAATVAVGSATQDATPANNAASVGWTWGNPLFYDGFESGALGAWSSHTP